MLTFYYHPLSPIARRVWLALLEKNIPFQSTLVNLGSGEQLKPDYTAINPFHHVPALVHDDLTLIESIAILDYLEDLFPTPSLRPNTPEAIARMRMVQMVVVNELMPKVGALMTETPSPKDHEAIAHIKVVLTFLSQQLGQANYFGGQVLNLADIVAGATIPLMVRLGLDLTEHPSIDRWQRRLIAREAWQATDPSEESLNAWKRWLQLQAKRKQRSRQKQRQSETAAV